MAGEELLELKFRLYDGSDIGPHKYAPATSVATLKESILSQWPQDKENGPKTIYDMKLINAGKVLENSKTLAESRVLVGELPGGVITMHVVIRPVTSDKSTDKQLADSAKSNKCIVVVDTGGRKSTRGRTTAVISRKKTTV